MAYMAIRILVCGGTFAKKYDEITGRLFFKDTHVSERFFVQFRAEFFNLFNHPLWAAPGTTVDTPLFGRVTSKTGNRTGQLGLKVIF